MVLFHVAKTFEIVERVFFLRVVEKRIILIALVIEFYRRLITQQFGEVIGLTISVTFVSSHAKVMDVLVL